MQKVSLFNDTLVTSKLGYGTSLLMARLGARESERLLEEAYENGITHFDTARSYGYGEAESIIGRFLRNKRDQVTITSKAGIVPPNRSGALKALRTMARAVIQVAPALRKTIRTQASKMVCSGNFDVPSVKASLETSLRELATEKINIFLLHECTVADLSEELYVYLEGAKQEGKIGYFGIATHAVDTYDILCSQGRFAQVVQVPHALGGRQKEDHVLEIAPQALITHSIFHGNLQGLIQPDMARRAMLEYAVHANRSGIVLFSSTNMHHIAENIHMLEKMLFTKDKIFMLKENLREKI